jgi:hypothetical protein
MLRTGTSILGHRIRSLVAGERQITGSRGRRWLRGAVSRGGRLLKALSWTIGGPCDPVLGEGDLPRPIDGLTVGQAVKLDSV